MSNEEVRILEKNIIKKNFDDPQIYLCSSLKEEFGLAILEAMSQGFLTLGPVNGGVKSYMENGVNGFLIDTSSWQTMALDTEKFLYHSNRTSEDFQKIQNEGRKTIEDSFSVKSIAEDFLAFYVGLDGGKHDEI